MDFTGRTVLTKKLSDFEMMRPVAVEGETVLLSCAFLPWSVFAILGAALAHAHYAAF